jgi:hypothetical protein
MLLVTAEEMRRLDQSTIGHGHASGELLMERAGAGVVLAMERRYGPMLGLRVLILCGTGNNGGDGMVAARHLRARGADVHAGVVGDHSRVRGEALAQLDRLTASGLTIASVTTEDELDQLVARKDNWTSRSTPCSARALVASPRDCSPPPSRRSAGWMKRARMWSRSMCRPEWMPTPAPSRAVRCAPI